MDATTRRLLTEALEHSEVASAISCCFQFCPGPDKPFKPMATCHVCRTTQLLRRALRRLDMPGK